MLRHAALCLLVFASGCWRSHARGDAGASVDASVPRDAGLEDASRDAGRDAMLDGGTDAEVVDGGVCEVFVEPLLRVCSYAATGSLPAGEPSELTLSFQACTCAGRRCDVSVKDGTIALTTASCSDVGPCDECENELTCAIPPLASGDFALRVDGRLVGTVPVRTPVPVTSARPICWGIQESIASGLTCDSRFEPEAETHCHRALEDVGTAVRIDIRYHDDPCAPPRECRAQLDGLDLRLTWSSLECTGDTCVGPSVLHTIRCVTPPLRAATYRVLGQTGAGFESTLEVRDVSSVPETRCFP